MQAGQRCHNVEMLGEATGSVHSVEMLDEVTEHKRAKIEAQYWMDIAVLMRQIEVHALDDTTRSAQDRDTK